MKNVKDADAFAHSLHNTGLSRRAQLLVLFSMESNFISARQLEDCGFSTKEVRAHLASLSFEGYHWEYRSPTPATLHHRREEELRVVHDAMREPTSTGGTYTLTLQPEVIA